MPILKPKRSFGQKLLLGLIKVGHLQVVNTLVFADTVSMLERRCLNELVTKNADEEEIEWIPT